VRRTSSGSRAAHGHDVRLTSPEYVRPYVKAQKNDDRDTERTLFLDRLPTPAEAIVIRDYLGIAKRPSLSQDHVARLRVQARRFGDDLRKKPLPATEPHHDLLQGDAVR
jgi:hypothetical protein